MQHLPFWFHADIWEHIASAGNILDCKSILSLRCVSKTVYRGCKNDIYVRRKFLGFPRKNGIHHIGTISSTILNHCSVIHVNNIPNVRPKLSKFFEYGNIHKKITELNMHHSLALDSHLVRGDIVVLGAINNRNDTGLSSKGPDIRTKFDQFYAVQFAIYDGHNLMEIITHGAHKYLMHPKFTVLNDGVSLNYYKSYAIFPVEIRCFFHITDIKTCIQCGSHNKNDNKMDKKVAYKKIAFTCGVDCGQEFRQELLENARKDLQSTYFTWNGTKHRVDLLPCNLHNIPFEQAIANVKTLEYDFLHEGRFLLNNCDRCSYNYNTKNRPHCLNDEKLEKCLCHTIAHCRIHSSIKIMIVRAIKSFKLHHETENRDVLLKQTGTDCIPNKFEPFKGVTLQSIKKYIESNYSFSPKHYAMNKSIGDLQNTESILVYREYRKKYYLLSEELEKWVPY